MAITLQDVARRAGVSPGAASTVLNGRHSSTIKVSEETSLRIQEAARELGYTPNAIARSLANGRTMTVALVMRFVSVFANQAGFFMEMVQGATEAAIETGYELMLHAKPDSDPQIEAAMIMNGRVDGALLVRGVEDPVTSVLHERHFPYVMMFCRTDAPDVWFVHADNVHGGSLATDYLLQLGHRRIAHICGPSSHQPAADRRTGFMKTLVAHGITPEPQWFVESLARPDNRQRLTALLRSPDRPTAVFAWYDYEAIEAMQIARDLGLRVPEDLSVVGYDSSFQCDQCVPPLTSVHQPAREVAHLAFTMLVHRLHGERVETTQKLFTPTLDIRRSCAPLNPSVR